MSTILKALRRLEQEKSVRADRPLEEAVASAAPVPAAPAPRSWPLVVGIAIGVVALGFAGFAAYQWSRSADPTAPVEVAAVPAEPKVEAARAPAKPSARAARAKPAARRTNERGRRGRDSRPTPAARPRPSPRPELSPGALTSDVAVVERAQPQPAPQIADSKAPAGAPAEEPTRSFGTASPDPSAVVPSQGERPLIDLSQLEALKAGVELPEKPSPERIAAARAAAKSSLPEPATSTPAAKAEPDPQPKSEPEPVEVAVARPAPKPTPRAEPRPEPKPELEPKPAAPARSVARKSPPRPGAPPPPKVHVTRTIWHPDATRRTAYVKLEGSDDVVELHEGDAIGPLLVTTIAPTGVTFDNRGSELKRRVGAR